MTLLHLQQELRKAATELAAIVPPKPIAAPQQLLLQGVQEYADELGAIIGKLKRGEPPPAALHAIASLKGVRDMGLASKEIFAKGYDILG